MNKCNITQGTASQRAKCYLYKLPVCKFSAEDGKYWLFTLLKTEVSNVLTLSNKYFLDREFHIELT